MKKLFQPTTESARKNVVLHFRVTASEADSISQAASARNLTTCEFVRRTALSRKTDIRYESKIIQELLEVAKAIYMIHAAVCKNEIAYVEADWNPVIDEIISAMRRIDK